MDPGVADNCCCHIQEVHEVWERSPEVAHDDAVDEVRVGAEHFVAVDASRKVHLEDSGEHCRKVAMVGSWIVRTRVWRSNGITVEYIKIVSSTSRERKSQRKP